LQAAFFEPEYVYTFHIAQHMVDVANYEVVLPIWHHKLFGHLDGQPIRFMAIKRGTKDYFWNLEVRPAEH
jgi:Protein of unknown function (DUF1769)